MSRPNLNILHRFWFYLLWLSILSYYFISCLIFNEVPVSYDVEKCQDEKMMIPIFFPAMTFQYYELYLTKLGLYDLFCSTHYPLILKQKRRESKEYILKGLPAMVLCDVLPGRTGEYYSLTFKLKLTEVVS